MAPNQTLARDAVDYIKMCYDAGSDALTPRVVGIELRTKAGKAVAIGNLLECKSMEIEIPSDESLIGLYGSSGTEMDSIGLITRVATH